MRKFLLSVLLLVVVAAVVVWIFRGPIAVRVMGRVVERNLQADPFDELPDGLHVTLCGAGGPFPDPARSAPCVAIVAGRSLYLVDSGSGASRNLTRVGFQPGQVDAVFLTHFHSDHIDGLGELGIMRWTGGSHRLPLPIYGAEGVSEIVQGLNQVYRLDSMYRTTHHGPEILPPTGSGFRARGFEEPPTGESVVVFEQDGLRVSAFRVDHFPIVPAVGYRFDYKGRSVVLSGDTSKSANLEQFASGVDLLVHEALSPELMGIIGRGAEGAGNKAIAKIAVDVLNYHATPLEVAELAESAGVGHLLYYHIVPPMPLPGLESIYLSGVAEAYAGPVTLGRDGTSVSLPAGSDEIIELER